ncbi:hypothetical protein KSS87_007469 [Heliosperma pusillum]|nr:hypothetical protein KSS87_007469 [Heliosperma pusillum]
MADTAEATPPATAAAAAVEDDSDIAATTATAASSKWPGWPGDNVFRLIVPVVKVGGIIGRKGELVKKLCDETRARIRVLDAPLSTPDRVVLISGKEEPDASLSPAMDAVIKLFKGVTGLSDGDDTSSTPDAAAFCSLRLLVASTQAIHLIGKQGSTIKSIQEASGAVVRILSEGDLPSYATSDERIVEIHGEAFKVQKALEIVLGHLRKFLHDHSIVAVFEKTYNATISQDRTADAWADKTQNLTSTNLPQTITAGDPLYPAISGLHSTGLTRAAAPIVTQVTQTMQVPLSYAEDIIGVAGTNIAHIRRSSGAALTVKESHGRGDEITVEIKGTAMQVQTAQQLIQESINGSRSLVGSSIYGKSELGLSSAYSQLSDNTYSSYASRGLGEGYSSSSLGGYSSYRFDL